MPIRRRLSTATVAAALILLPLTASPQTSDLSSVVLQSGEHGTGADLIWCESAKITTAFVQMAPLRTCSDHLCGGMASAIFALLS